MSKRISDEAVKKSTGKIWKEWFSLLNKIGAKKMEHKQIAKLLYDKYELSSWWSQMVTVQYEQDVKGRKKHEKPDGYQISKSITLPFSVTNVFNAVNSVAKRKVWLKDFDFKISKSTKNKSIRGKWVDGVTNIDVQFYPKNKNKTQVVVQHNKIRNLNEAEKLKKYWENNFKFLKDTLAKANA
ncbi:MAG: hypothetical protein ACHQLA_00880 [Ignavibacteriales bacterium]